MNAASKQFLDENRHHHDTLVKAFYLRSLSGATRETMQRIMGEEFQKGYATDLWCPPCVSDMVLALYRNYDNWIAAQPVAVPDGQPVQDSVQAPAPEVSSPVQPESEVKPIIVAANFPSNLPGVNSENVIPSDPLRLKENSSVPSNKKRRR